MTERPDLGEEQDMLAAGLAFGLLDADERASAEALRRDDGAFATAVLYWEAQAVMEMAALPPVQPPATLWSAVAAATYGDGVDTAGTAANDSAPGSTARPIDAAARQRQVARQLVWWRGGALVGGALAAGLALLLVLPAVPPDPAPLDLATTRLATVQVVGSDDQPIATAVFDSAAGTMRIRLDVADGAVGIPELWVIPGDGMPRSLGRRADGAVRLTPEQQRLVFGGGQFAVSLEPDDGTTSPTPRGTVLGAGAIQLL